MLTGKLSVDLDKRYSVIEAAKALGITRKTLDKYASQNLIHPILHKPTGRFFYTGEEIKRFYDHTI